MKNTELHNLRFTILDLRFVKNSAPQKKIDRIIVNTFNLKSKI